MMKAYKLLLAIMFVTGPVVVHAQVSRPFTPSEVFLADLASIVSHDATKLSKWYIDNLGFKIYKELNISDTLKINFLKKGNFMLEIVGKPKAADRRPMSSFENPSITGFNKISFRVVGIMELGKKLKVNDVKFKTNIFHDDLFRLTSFIIEDPEGNLIQFVEYD